MFWIRKPKQWRPQLVTDIERWMTDPCSSDDKILEGVTLSMRVLMNALDMALYRQRYRNRLIQQFHLPARERLDSDK